ncbi:retrovirus-related pol polyprotein from transposon TNT 1-94, partial [Tanacetum coccineum]
MALHLLHQSKDPATIILLSNTAAGVAVGIVMLKIVPKTPLQFGVAERLSQTFRAESTGLRLLIPEEECGLDEMRYSFRDTKSHQVIRSRDITFVDLIYTARSVTDSSSLTKPIQKIKKSLKAQVGAQIRVRGLKTVGASRIVEDHMKKTLKTEHSPRREALRLHKSYSEALSSKESVQWKKAIIEEMVSLEKNQTCSLVTISAGKKASQRLWMFKVKEEQNDSKRFKARLVVKGFQ